MQLDMSTLSRAEQFAAMRHPKTGRYVMKDALGQDKDIIVCAAFIRGQLWAVGWAPYSGKTRHEAARAESKIWNNLLHREGIADAWHPSQGIDNSETHIEPPQRNAKLLRR